MGFVRDTFFGGAERRAGDRAQEAGQESARIAQEAFQDIRGLSVPFIEPGQQAFQRQAGLSGALGPEEQAQAFGQFEESPGVQFLREEGLRFIDSGAAATGGLGGGERLRELTKFSQGLALQDLNNQFNRLGAVTGGGLSALGSLGGVSTASAAGQAQGLQSGAAGFGAGLVGQAGARRNLAVEGAQAAGFFSDPRLKKNIRKIGELSSGLNIYGWEWTEEGEALCSGQKPIGVMADEAQEIFPDAVFESEGYLKVDYGRLH